VGKKKRDSEAVPHNAKQDAYARHENHSCMTLRESTTSEKKVHSIFSHAKVDGKFLTSQISPQATLWRIVRTGLSSFDIVSHAPGLSLRRSTWAATYSRQDKQQIHWRRSQRCTAQNRNYLTWTSQQSNKECQNVGMQPIPARFLDIRTSSLTKRWNNANFVASRDFTERLCNLFQRSRPLHFHVQPNEFNKRINRRLD